MNRCLSDDSLLLLYEGSGTRTHQEHLASCESCRAHYERLARDLQLIGRVLRDPPPVEEVSAFPHSRLIRWIPVAVVSAAAFFLLWGKGWIENLPFPRRLSQTPLSAPASSMEVRDEELAVLLAKTVTPALFSAVDLRGGKLPEHATNLAYLKAALDGGWPSEKCEQARSDKCDNDPFGLLFENQGN